LTVSGKLIFSGYYGFAARRGTAAGRRACAAPQTANRNQGFCVVQRELSLTVVETRENDDPT
jgi:hypothetical protein